MTKRKRRQACWNNKVDFRKAKTQKKEITKEYKALQK